MKYITILLIILIVTLFILNKDDILARYSNDNVAAVSGSTYPKASNYVLYLDVDPGPEAGSISGGRDGGKYKKGTRLTLRATNKPGYFFSGWDVANHENCDTSSLCRITIDTDIDAVAYFKPFIKLPDKKCKFADADKEDIIEKINNDQNLTPEQKAERIRQINTQGIFSCSKFWTF